MKRRIAGALLSVALLLALAVPLAERTAAADNVYFTAANDELCPLNDETMPFWSGGNLYVPGLVFSASYGLGITYVRDTAAQTAFLYAGRLALEFDLAEGGANNRSGTYYSASALRRGNTVFFPVAFVSNYFGLSYSVQETAYAPVVRVCNGNQILTDRQFIDAASITLMPSYYNAYQRSKKPAVTQKPEDGNDPGEVTPPAPPEGEPAGGGASQVLLAVRAGDSRQTASMLNTLDRFGYKATFFFTPGSLMEQDDLLRRIVASGHRLGLILPEDGGAEELQAANGQLRRRTGTTTRMVLAADRAGEVQTAGYAVYTPAYTMSAFGTSSNRAAAVMNRVENGSGTLKLLFPGDSSSASALAVVCAGLSEGRYTVRAATEVACAGA